MTIYKLAAYERSTERRDYRNGYYERDLIMSIGKITLKSTSNT